MSSSNVNAIKKALSEKINDHITSRNMSMNSAARTSGIAINKITDAAGKNYQSISLETMIAIAEGIGVRFSLTIN